MNIRFSPKILADMKRTLQSTLERDGIINLPKVAEEIRLRNESDNIALEDITLKLMEKAQILHAAMEFDTGLLIPPTEDGR